MKERRYIVLTKKFIGGLEASPGGARGSRGAGGEDPPELSVQVDNFSDGDLRAATASPGYLAHAPVFPLKLVSPDGSAAVGAAAAAPPGWGLKEVGLPSGFRGKGVKVAVLDTGIDSTHPVFAPIVAKITIKDYTGQGTGDDNGHGTHCSGVLFGQDIGGQRLSVAPDVEEAFIGKVLDKDGVGNSLDLFEAMQWAIINQVSVVSMSLGFDFAGEVERRHVKGGVPLRLAASDVLGDFLANIRVFDTIVRLGQQMAPIYGGTLFVAAAGNDSTPAYKLAVAPPGSAENVVSVGALAQAVGGLLDVANYSNHSPTVCAPGSNIVSAYPTALEASGWKALYGTSMATPHVAGAAALWFESMRSGGLPATASTVTAKLTATAILNRLLPGIAPHHRGSGLVQTP